jgi:hypothetical protein
MYNMYILICIYIHACVYSSVYIRMYTLPGGQVGAPAQGRDTKPAAAAGNQLAGGGGESTAGNHFAEAPRVQRRRAPRVSRAAGPA